MVPRARFVLSRGKLLEQYRKVRELGRVSYSMKTNHTAAGILEKETDALFSAHTSGELEFVKDMGRVLFLAESWTRKELEGLYRKGVRSFAVHNMNDLRVLEDFLKEGGKIDLFLRIKLREHSIFTEKYFVFGFDSRAVNELIPKLRANKGVGRLGVHFHRKTENVGEWNLKYEMSNALSEEALKAIDIMNIGGGLPIAYKNVSDRVIGSVFKSIGELREWLSGYGIELMLEPGRFLSGPAVKLMTRIINIGGRDITVNASVYNSSSDTLIMPLRLLVEGEREAAEGIREYTIKGCTPCSMDMFRYSVFLPEKGIGDEIVFLNAGAYGFHTDFCSLERLETEVVD